MDRAWPPDFKFCMHRIIPDEGIIEGVFNGRSELLRRPEVVCRPKHSLTQTRRETINDEQFTRMYEGLLRQPFEKSPVCTWFHIPANHMGWVESFFAAYDGGTYSLDEELWTQMVRPELSGNRPPPVHATHMLPTFRESPYWRRCRMTLYLPYMNLETCNEYCSLYEVYTGRKWPHQLEHRSSGRSTDPNLLWVQREIMKLHPRRTLDQFKYPFLSDTVDRDADQTVSKWTSQIPYNEEVKKPDATSRLIMVDQLWCWVIDDRTVLTCFPSHENQYSDREFRDLYNCISQELFTSMSISELCAVIGAQTVTHLHTPRNQRFLDPIGIYQKATDKATVDQIELFQQFQRSSAEGTPSFSDQQDLALLRDVADMADELKMIVELVTTQSDILSDLYSTLFDRAEVQERIQDQSQAAKTTLSNVLRIVADMIKEGERTRDSAIQLLDLKQKSATLSEARSTAQQGRAVMLFTIVTVIFLPLSFFTSYFGQNVSEITGDSSNPSSWDLWKVGMPISVTIILVALFIAFIITRTYSPTQWVRSWRLLRANRQRMSHGPGYLVELHDHPNGLDRPLRTSILDLEAIANSAAPAPESRPQPSTPPSGPPPHQSSALPRRPVTPDDPQPEPSKAGGV